MNITFTNEISSNYMIVEKVTEFSPDLYAVRILTENRIEGLLPFDYKMLNGRTDYLYDISSKTSLDRAFEHSKMRFEDLKKLLFSLNALIRNLGAYLLDPNDVMLKKECLFLDQKKERYEYCYLPCYGGNLLLETRELFAVLLSVIDYEDTKAVRLAYEIQKEAQMDYFTLETLMRTVGKISAETEKHMPEESFVAEEEYRFSARSEDVRPPVPEIREEEGFFKKAGMYFREQDASTIFDDINEMKIFGKIKTYGAEEKEPTVKKRKHQEKNDRGRKKKTTGKAQPQDTEKNMLSGSFTEPDGKPEVPELVRSFDRGFSGY